MIINFKHRGLKRLFERGDRRRLPADMVDRIGVVLAAIVAAQKIEELERPSFRLHALKGTRKGEWAITVRANWRIVFRFEDGDAFDVNFVDYH